MKTWKNPEFTELDIGETAHGTISKKYPDGGWTGDGEWGFGWPHDSEEAENIRHPKPNVPAPVDPAPEEMHS